MLTYFSYSLCVENFYLAWDKYATILLKFTLRELLLNQLKLLKFVYLNVLSGVLKELFLKWKFVLLWNHHCSWGPRFVAFVGNPCPRIYTPTNLYTIFCLKFIEITPMILPKKLRPHETGQFWHSTNIDSHK